MWQMKTQKWPGALRMKPVLTDQEQCSDVGTEATHYRLGSERELS